LAKTFQWTEDWTQRFNEAYERFASQGQRVLAFAKIDLARSSFAEGFEFRKDPANFPQEEFTFVGLVSLMDPPKKGVRKALAACRTAGIQVVMVTGDHPITAEVRAG
jgi:sodium/potassium-transporting ATPase subunit alpha